MPKIKLKPCPFCGCKTISTQYDIWFTGTIYFVECPGCCIQGPHKYRKESAIAAWNKHVVINEYLQGEK